MQSKYSIKDLEYLTGIKAHTLRIWEQRYNVVEPRRTDTNIRYYGDEELKRLLNITLLVNSGQKISKVAELTDEQLREMVLRLGAYRGELENQIHGLKLAMLDFDEVLFDRILTQSMISIGGEETFTKLVGSFIHQIGILWQTSSISVAHEHFASGIIKQKIYSAVDQLPLNQSQPGKIFILYLPGDELHELGLLYLYYYIRKRGHRVIYLGQSVPLEYLKDAMDKLNADVLVTMATTQPPREFVQEYFSEVSKAFPETRILASGMQLEGIDLALSNVITYESLAALVKEI